MKGLKSVLLVQLALLLTGCAVFDEMNDSFYPPLSKVSINRFTAKERVAAGTTGIVMVDADFRVFFGGVHTGGKAAGAAGGVVQGAFHGCAAAAEFPPLIIITVPAGALIGGVGGSIESENKDVIDPLVDRTGRTIRQTDPRTYFMEQLSICSGISPPLVKVDDEYYRIYSNNFDSIMQIYLCEIGTRTANYDRHPFTRDVVDVIIKCEVRIFRTSDGKKSVGPFTPTGAKHRTQKALPNGPQTVPNSFAKRSKTALKSWPSTSARMPSREDGHEPASKFAFNTPH